MDNYGKLWRDMKISLYYRFYKPDFGFADVRAAKHQLTSNWECSGLAPGAECVLTVVAEVFSSGVHLLTITWVIGAARVGLKAIMQDFAHPWHHKNCPKLARPLKTFQE
jgi:hypothetical protein